MQRRHQRAHQGEPAGDKGKVTPRAKLRARSSPLPENHTANPVRAGCKQQWYDDPGIERPNRPICMWFEFVREPCVRRIQHHQRYQAYRSHPLSTNPANPCIERAKANTIAARTPIDPTKRHVRRGSDVRMRSTDRQDIVPEKHAMAAPTNERIAEHRA